MTRSHHNHARRNTGGWKLGAALFALLLVVPSHHAVAQDVADDENIEELTVIGSRVPARSVSETTVPVDVLNRDALETTGAREAGRALQQLAPSFHFPSSTVTDGTDSLRPATLRGMGPDHVLVTVNGKRRHNSALVHLNGSVGQGTAGVDMNAIPIAAIGGIQVLRDGAAAQYGSDAIAGVIDLQLRKFTGFEFDVSTGRTSEGDGARHDSLVCLGVRMR